MNTVLVTGITGTFGQAFLDSPDDDGWTIRGYSRDEHKQHELAETYPAVRWLLGDVRDLARLKRAMEGCDTVIHAAALKHVTACEKNPGEALKTNAVGTMNVAEACLDTGVTRAVFLSSDKAVHPVNVYGASKNLGERLFLASNAYGGNRCRFSVVRYGNVRGSRGSVLEKSAYNPVSLTDSRATRFWMDRSGAVEAVLLALREMHGGEVFLPKLEAARVADVVDHDGTEVGLRRGEKLHERLVSDEEVPHTYDFGDHYRICPEGYMLNQPQPFASGGQSPMRVPADFIYASGP